MAAGWREFAKDVPHSDWALDADVGPVLADYGATACIFGIGAARKNGRFDRAYPLTAETLAAVGELPNGFLALPYVLSIRSQAPMLGEAAILWVLSVQPEKGLTIKTGGTVPVCVYVALIAVFLFGGGCVMEAIWRFKEWKREPEHTVRAIWLQLVLWAGLLVSALGALVTGQGLIGVLLLLAAAVLPVEKRKKKKKGAEDWPGEKPASEAGAQA